MNQCHAIYTNIEHIMMHQVISLCRGKFIVQRTNLKYRIRNAIFVGRRFFILLLEACEMEDFFSDENV